MIATFIDLLGVDEAVVPGDVVYFYGAVSVGPETGWHKLRCYWHVDFKRIEPEHIEQYIGYNRNIQQTVNAVNGKCLIIVSFLQKAQKNAQ